MKRPNDSAEPAYNSKDLHVVWKHQNHFIVFFHKLPDVNEIRFGRAIGYQDMVHGCARVKGSDLLAKLYCAVWLPVAKLLLYQTF